MVALLINDGGVVGEVAGVQADPPDPVGPVRLAPRIVPQAKLKPPAPPPTVTLRVADLVQRVRALVYDAKGRRRERRPGGDVLLGTLVMAIDHPQLFAAIADAVDGG